MTYSPVRGALLTTVLCLSSCQVQFEPEVGGGGGGGNTNDTGGGDGAPDVGPGRDVRPCVPEAEVCNGLDDDCNGQVDDGLGEDTCGEGGCRRTVSLCQDGLVTECTPAAPSLEVCNGEDDDCDGETDESDEGGPLTRDCYTGGAGTLDVGLCRGGERTCQEGTYPEAECPGEVTPVAEEDNDGQDDDCDGQTDEGFASLFFAGQRDSRVELPEQRDIGLRDREFTLEAWIRPTSLTYYRANPIISRRSEGSGEGWMLGVVGLGNFEEQGLHARGVVFLVGSWPADAGGGREDGELLASGPGVGTVADDAWAHVAVMFGYRRGTNGSHQVALFVDGKLVAVSSQFARDIPQHDRVPPAWLGADPRDTAHNFHGRIADVRISDGQAYALDNCSLGQRCFSPATCLTTEEAVLAHWPLAEGEGNRAWDASGNGLHGTIVGVTDGPGSRWRTGEACADRAANDG